MWQEIPIAAPIFAAMTSSSNHGTPYAAVHAVVLAGDQLLPHAGRSQGLLCPSESRHHCPGCCHWVRFIVMATIYWWKCSNAVFDLPVKRCLPDSGLTKCLRTYRHCREIHIGGTRRSFVKKMYYNFCAKQNIHEVWAK